MGVYTVHVKCSSISSPDPVGVTKHHNSWCLWWSDGFICRGWLKKKVGEFRGKGWKTHDRHNGGGGGKEKQTVPLPKRGGEMERLQKGEIVGGKEV